MILVLRNVAFIILLFNYVKSSNNTENDSRQRTISKLASKLFDNKRSGSITISECIMLPLKSPSHCCGSLCVRRCLITVTFKPETLTLSIGESQNVSLKFSHSVNESVTLFFDVGDKEKEKVETLQNVTVPDGNDRTIVTITGKTAGYASIGVNTTSKLVTKVDHVFLHVTIVHSHTLYIISQIVGWIYFLAWSISFYPQFYVNWKRKSVVGLNFDFLALNIIGFSYYAIFNIGLFWIPEIQKEYYDLYPRDMIPVELNDVIFAIHAVVITAFTIIQVFIYERGDQKVSYVCRGILCIYVIIALVCLFVVLGHKMSWLSYLYVFSYIKLSVTLIKYTPQALMNFRRKSTEGWSIGMVLMDFTGGTFSILQMFLLSYNRNDWQGVFGNPTKFGLGLFSILFDLVFLCQHYVLYRGNSPQGSEEEEINNDEDIDTTSQTAPLVGSA